MRIYGSGSAAGSHPGRNCLLQPDSAGIKDGDPESAAAMLGTPYEVEGIVVHGRALGRTISFPTINLQFQEGQLVPRHGVYAADVQTPDGAWYWGVANVGVKPTIAAGLHPSVEVHLLDYSGDLYGAVCRVQLHHFLRSEQQFETITQLQAAIAQDCIHAREWVAKK